jgi:hypothetical protein
MFRPFGLILRHSTVKRACFKIAKYFSTISDTVITIKWMKTVMFKILSVKTFLVFVASSNTHFLLLLVKQLHVALEPRNVSLCVRFIYYTCAHCLACHCSINESTTGKKSHFKTMSKPVLMINYSIYEH